MIATYPSISLFMSVISPILSFRGLSFQRSIFRFYQKTIKQKYKAAVYEMRFHIINS